MSGGTGTGGASNGGSGTGGSGTGGSGTGGATNGGSGTGGATNGGSATGGTGTGGASNGGTGTGGSGNRFPCLDPQPIKEDLSGGLIACSGGWTHRASDGVCAISVPRATVLPPSQFPEYDQCTRDADCTEKPFGYCSGPNTSGGVIPSNTCAYGCEKDADCATGTLCACGSLTGTCITASCRTDGDCEAGFLCASYLADPGCDFPAYACQAANDTCVTDSDCAPGKQCTVANGPNGRSCQLASCAIGRPFLVDGRPRLAQTLPRNDWLVAGFSAPRDGLSKSERARLSAAWLDIARMEHASIAAFARFTLELLAFGAPSELVCLSNAALADETRHAAQAFALASGYAGHGLGPGPLDTALGVGPFELEQSVFNAFLEGCIGETVAALEARLALDSATDPEVCRVLAGVVEDEARHAELAWRFVKWALPRAEGSLRERLLKTVLQLSDSAECQASSRPPDATLKAHGVLEACERAQLRRSAIAEIVRPCLEALLQNTPGSVYAPNTSRSTLQISSSVA